MLEIDSGSSIGGHNDLQLVVPPIGTGSDLVLDGVVRAVLGVVFRQLVGSVQHVGRGLVLGSGRAIVQHQNKERRVDNRKALRVGGRSVPDYFLSRLGPLGSVQAGQHTEGRNALGVVIAARWCARARALGGLGGGSSSGSSDVRARARLRRSRFRAMRIGPNGLQNVYQVALVHRHISVRPQGLKVVELVAAHDGHVVALVVHRNRVAGLELGHPRGTKQCPELVHAQRLAPESIRLECLVPELARHLDGGKTQVSRPRDLVSGQLGIGGFLQQKVGIQVEHHARIWCQVGLAPEFFHV
mmetsp:Transcript_14933/g.41560  ORF Transcript_14933/g.41560 Transcript_14933/m.41560 type:complete len:300 (-) Transcript_14933:943-1842(-)